MQSFVWQPGSGPDQEALERIKAHFRRPKESMGEAWFMGKRRFFPELLGDLADLTVEQLQKPLEEIASGVNSFGAFDEWRNWYHHLLGELLSHSHERYVHSLLELLVTGFMSLHPDGVHPPPYPGFQEDALLTLGRCLMAPQRWVDSGNDTSGPDPCFGDGPEVNWLWWNNSQTLSASLFFCLKYVPPPLVAGWFASVLTIASPIWRAQVLGWLVEAHGVLSGSIRWPSEFQPDTGSDIGWEWSHALGPERIDSMGYRSVATEPFLPDVTCTQVLAMTRAHFTDDVFLVWLEAIGSVPELGEKLGFLPSDFESLYMCR